MTLVSRTVQMLALLGVLSVALFYVLHLMPGSAEDLLIASNPTIARADVERLHRLRGLDRPIHRRYVCWLLGRAPGGDDGERCAWWPGRGLLRGDLGYSRVHKSPVVDIIGLRLSNTLTLMLPALLLAFFGSIALGVLSVMGRGRWPDYLISGLAFGGIALPVHWIGLIAIGALAVGLGWFPVGGVEDPRDPGLLSRMHHAALPVFILALFYIGRWTRYTRSALLEVVDLDYVRTARAKGLSEAQVLLRHALPSALFPLLTVVTQSMPSLFSGAMVTERVFAYQGMGLLIFESVVADDHMVAMTAFIAFAALTMLATLLAESLYKIINPRVRGGATL